jgi:6-phosphogluconolactonase
LPRRATLILGFVLLFTVSAGAGQSQTSSNSAGSPKLMLYASVGPELSFYEVDVQGAALIKRGSVKLPANVQEAVPHPSKQYLYVAWSNGGPTYNAPGGGSRHGITTFRINRASGALEAMGQPVPLPSRPIHVTTDIPGQHVLVAYNDPSGVTVQRIMPDGTAGAEVKPAGRLDTGIYGHNVRVDPSNKTVILVTRGNGPAGGKPEDPGALKIFSFKDGVLTNRASIAPEGGFNHQFRHLDFHPSKPWIFVTLERQNKLQVYKKSSDGTPAGEPLFTKDTLTAPGKVQPGQAVSTIHMHPTGKFVYLANRASGTTNFEGKPVFAGGENSIAVFQINPDTGEPRLIQNIDTRGIHPRTFALDADAHILVAANQMSLSVRDGNRIIELPASLSLFRMRDDGKLEFARKYDVEVGPNSPLFWMGLVSLR